MMYIIVESTDDEWEDFGADVTAGDVKALEVASPATKTETTKTEAGEDEVRKGIGN